MHWGAAVITNDLIALTIFWVAAATDLLDGYLARRWGQVTTIGTLLDPIADKLLISSALIALVQQRVVASWIVVVIIGREFAVSGLRSIAAAEGYTIKASELGKTKTMLQVLAISLLMLAMRHTGFRQIANLTLYAVVILAVWSAIAYFNRFWRKIDTATKKRRRQELLMAERQSRRAAFAARREARQQAKQIKAGHQTQERDFSAEPADLPPSV